MKKHVFYLFLTVVLLSGCGSLPEVTSEMDFVFGEGYATSIQRVDDFTPKRILLLPVTGNVQPDYKEAFLGSFMAAWEQQGNQTVVVWPGSMVDQEEMILKKAEVMARARALGCDAILLVNLKNHRFSPPLRLTVHLTMEKALNGSLILDGRTDFDAQNRDVANSARRFYQNKLQKTASPDRSMTILENNDLYMKFTGFYSAQSLIFTFNPPVNEENMQKTQKKR